MRTALAALALLALIAPATHAADRLPNVVIIFMDDMGYADIGPFGARKYPTPNLDRMAKEGTKFTSFYAAQPVCSASRAALLTGCYSNRIGINGALGPTSPIGIHDDEVTIAEICKQKNYATAIYGKWHLGHHPQFLPTRHGFDEYFGLPYSNDMWPYHPERPNGFPALPLLDQETVVNSNVTAKDQEQLTTQYTERAVKFIKQNKDRPFFLYVPHSMVHVPLYVSDKFRGKSGAGLFGDVVMEVDWSVGQILDALKASKIDEHTLVVFTSDNGPWLSYGDHGGSAEPLREGKGTTFEGGVREPTLMRWPGRVPAGRSCDEPMMTIDLLPTIAKLIGAKLPSHRIDGLDISDVMFDKPGAKSPHEVLYFYYGNNNLEALRSGKWKLELPRPYRTMQGQAPGKDGIPGKYATRTIAEPELYDLSADVSQKHNIASQHPEVVKQMLAFAEQARADLGDGFTKRPGANRREPGRIPGSENHPAKQPGAKKKAKAKAN